MYCKCIALHLRKRRYNDDGGAGKAAEERNREKGRQQSVNMYQQRIEVDLMIVCGTGKRAPSPVTASSKRGGGATVKNVMIIRRALLSHC